jgi:hypothetical protein
MSAWICGNCRAGVHGNHEAGGNCALTGSPGPSGTPCACEHSAAVIQIGGIPADELPAIVNGETYIPVPAYVAEMAGALAATEDHPDPLVRSIRKMAVQSILVLHQLSWGQEEEAEPEPDPDAAGWSFADEPPAEEKPKRKTSATVELMAQHGITAAEVREWAAEHGASVSGRGALAIDLVQAYLAAKEVGA